MIAAVRSLGVAAAVLGEILRSVYGEVHEERFGAFVRAQVLDVGDRA
ncbi:hypothetical protein ACQP0C_09080 [Nocardia sp. CA-129566]